ncbi:hypothetical protein MJO29_011834 [Puccinia striiformis f. sp. tritici]|nr:hypothetical protein MJO29_011834 [Puccinia striiformis f. sp. tritici]
MLARLSSPSGFGTDLLDFKIAAALAENNSPGNHGPYSNSDSLHFQSFTRTGTDLGINENSTEAAGDNNLKIWCKEVAEKWHTLTPEIKMKYKDYDFIKTLRGDVPVELVNGTIQTTRQVHVANTALNLGSNKRAASQGIQGMLIIASVRSSGDLFIQGGTNLGRNFISMLRKGGDPIKKFQTYIAGMAAAEEVCGGPVCTNKKIIGAKMKELLNAAGGKYFKAWPGSNVVRDLNAASIQLKVKRNAADFQVKELCQPVNTLLLDSSQRILQAIGKGWISLRYIEDGVNNSFMEEGTQHCRKIWLNCCQLTCRSYGSTVASI